MLQLYNFGLYFIEALSEIGDFLLFRPFATPELIDKYDFLLNAKNKLVLLSDIHAYENVSVAGVILGAGLVGVLTFKIAKFFLGIITGS